MKKPAARPKSKVARNQVAKARPVKKKQAVRKPQAKAPAPAQTKPRALSRADAVRYERALVEEKRRILRQGSIAEKIMESCAPSATGDLSVHRTHTADQGTENYQREMASRLRSIEADTLRLIDDALRRIADGTYGICGTCGAPIPKARLEVVPHARFCMKCLQKK